MPKPPQHPYKSTERQYSNQSRKHVPTDANAAKNYSLTHENAQAQPNSVEAVPSPTEKNTNTN